MRFVHAPRACAILYRVLVSRREKHPWLLPANICPVVPLTFMKAGVAFELVDISGETLHMDLEVARRRIQAGRFGGLLYAPTYGDAASPNDAFGAIRSADRGVLIVDDRCLCIPQFDVQSSADVVLYSTGLRKIVDLHIGGYAFLRDNVAYEPVRLPFDPNAHDEIENAYKRAVRKRIRFVHRELDWLETEASMPGPEEYRRQIEDELTRSLEQRSTLNAIYASRLPAELQFPAYQQNWRFNIRVRNQSQVMKAIFDAGLFASSHYASLAGVMAPGRADLAENLAREVINLFNDGHFDPARARQVCDVILANLAA